MWSYNEIIDNGCELQVIIVLVSQNMANDS